MERIFNFSRKHPIIAIIILAVGCVLAGLNLNKLFIDSSSESMMMKNDPERDFYRDTLDKFGSDTMVMIYVEDPDLFTVEKLEILEQMVTDLNDQTRFPSISRVESLYSVSNIKGYPGYLDNNPLMDYPPETEEEARRVKEIAVGNPVLVDNLISKTGDATVVNLYMVPNSVAEDKKTAGETIRAVGELIHDKKTGYGRHFTTMFEIGRPYMSEEITRIILQDMGTILPIAFAVLMIMLIITMGSLNGALLPFITSSLSILFTLGFMGAAGLPFNMLTFVVPILVIVIGSTEDVHILSEYMEGLAHTGNRVSSIKYMARVVATAIFLTSLTTFLGFMSIAINKIVVLIQFGIIAGFAMLINPITTCLIAPMYLKHFGAKQVSVKPKKKRIISRFIESVGEKAIFLVQNRKKLIMILLLGLAVVIGVFTFFIEVDNDTAGYFKKGSDLITRLDTIHEEMAGAQTFFIRIRRRTLDDLLDSERKTPGEPKSVASSGASGAEEDPFADDAESMDLFDEGPETDDLFEDDMESMNMFEEGPETGALFEDDSESMDLFDEGAESTDLFADDAESMDLFSDDTESIDLFGQDSVTVDAVLDDNGGQDSPDIGNNKNLFHNPAYLRMLETIQDRFREDYDFDNTISIADYIKLVHKEMNVGIPGDFDTTPDPEDPVSRNLIAQYALTLHHDEVSSYITSDWSEANILIRHNIFSSAEIKKVIARAESEIADIIAEVDPLLEFSITGENVLVNKAADSITTSQIFGLGLLLLTILIIMSILFLNIKAGLLALVPNIFPIFIFFGLMGIFKIPLNLGTCMVAAIAIGISVDDSIHFMTRFNQEMRIVQDREKAVERVIRSEVRPIVSTSMALILGFAILVFAHLMPLVYFGLLSAIVMFCAMVADLLITPILLSSVQLTNIAEITALNVAEELKDSPIFQGMTQLEIKRFTLLGKVQTIPKDDYLIKSGDPGRQIFIILNGSATVTRNDNETGEPVFISDIGPGSILGEISLLQHITRTANVVAKEDLRYLEIDWPGLMRLRRSAKQIALKLYKNIAAILGKRLVAMTDKVQELQSMKK